MDAAKLGADFPHLRGIQVAPRRLRKPDSSGSRASFSLPCALRRFTGWPSRVRTISHAKLDFRQSKAGRKTRAAGILRNGPAHFNFKPGPRLMRRFEICFWRAGAETVRAHNHALIDSLLSRFGRRIRCVAREVHSIKISGGPYGCFIARTPEKNGGTLREAAPMKMFSSGLPRNRRFACRPISSTLFRTSDRLISRNHHVRPA